MEKEVTKFVTIRMPKSIVEKIDFLAIDSMRTRSSQILFLIKNAIEEEKTQECVD